MEPIGAWARRPVPPQASEGQDVAELAAGIPDTQAPASVEGGSGQRTATRDGSSLPKTEEKSRPSVKGITSVTGIWTIRESGGGSCRLHLSSVPTLDLYKASTSRCRSRTLQDVNAWKLRGDNIVLYSHGTVVTDLRQDGGSFKSNPGESGNSITISR